MKLRHLFLFCVICCSVSIFAQNKSKLPKTSGNPIFPGWYADPEGIVFGDEYWIYPTYSAAYDDQIFMDAFSSKDLVNWTKHPRILEKKISVGFVVLCGHRLSYMRTISTTFFRSQ